MIDRCECQRAHRRRRIVLTGGPGAGKTAVLELLRKSVCQHIEILPEAAGIVFSGGFPRRMSLGAQRAAQRAIFQVQCELEAVADAEERDIAVCDRGTVDGVAYWPGPEDFWSSQGTTRESCLRRYDVVIHLRVPDTDHGFGHQNPLRIESAALARVIDDRILRAWEGHPRRHIVDATPDFMVKAREVLDLLRRELPECWSNDATHPLDEPKIAPVSRTRHYVR
jgi:hypothetical protein